MAHLRHLLQFTLLTLLVLGGALPGLHLDQAARAARLQQSQALTAPAKSHEQVAASPEATTQIFGNNTPITINDNTTASPYPSTTTVSNVNPATVTRVSVVLSQLTHTFPDNVDVILVGPGNAQ